MRIGANFPSKWPTRPAGIACMENPLPALSLIGKLTIALAAITFLLGGLGVSIVIAGGLKERMITVLVHYTDGIGAPYAAKTYLALSLGLCRLAIAMATIGFSLKRAMPDLEPHKAQIEQDLPEAGE